ncbi:MAG: prepilin-type N-terminal cleavage/methylation domain-containing protein [Sulfurimonas sp.]|jgi:general secretion pathway protein G|nr:prepilin-type N-terminal cleavage/methylation domain-containing protein [Sulfurimonas sp.]
MQKSKNAFTMIEMIFVIVILGILAAIAIPRFAATRTDAQIAKGRSDIASIRSAIVNERQTWLIRGVSTYIKTGTDTETINGATRKKMDNGGLFGGVLMSPITNSSTQIDGKWHSTAGSGTYYYQVSDTQFKFDYNATTGIFACSTSTTVKLPCSIWD